MQLNKPRRSTPVPNQRDTKLGLSRAVLCLALLSGAAAQASTTVINFNEDPTQTTPPKVTSITGSAAWIPTGGKDYDVNTNATDGYLKLNDAVNSTSGQVIFPDFDNGAVIQGFNFECWVRIGNCLVDPPNVTPADGFSISYARSPLPNPVLYNSSTPGNSDAEEGSRTGLAVGFDCYDNGTTPPDPRGLDIWVDGVQVYQFPMPNINGSVTDITSLQTGPNDGTGSPDGLGWAHCVVNLGTDGLLNVYYKDFQILTNFQTHFVPGPGQLVMAGRTGGLNENQHVDNITITTTPSQNVVAGTATGVGDGVQVSFFDSGAGVVDVTKPATVSIDGAWDFTKSKYNKNGVDESWNVNALSVGVTFGF